MDYILDFCGHCGTLLPPGIGQQPTPKCPNCNEDISTRTNRIRGLFPEADAKRLLDLFGYPE